MKKILFLFAFVMFAGLVSAQDTAAKKSCAKTCAKTCASKKASASVDGETKVASAETAAELAAAEDESIERKVCDVSGSISYYRKSTCSVSGATKMTEVQYDGETKSFVNVSPKDVMSAEAEAKVVKTSSKDKKSCAKKCAKTCASKKSGA